MLVCAIYAVAVSKSTGSDFQMRKTKTDTNWSAAIGKEQGVGPVTTGLGEEEPSEEGGKRGRDGRRVYPGHAQHDGRVLGGEILVTQNKPVRMKAAKPKVMEETDHQANGLVRHRLDRSGVDDETDDGEHHGADAEAKRLRTLADLRTRERLSARSLPASGAMIAVMMTVDKYGRMERKEDLDRVTPMALAKKDGNHASKTVREVVPREVRDGERPELRVASERAPRDVETLLFARGRRSPSCPWRNRA